MTEVKITKEFLKKHNVCADGYDWWLMNCEGLSDKKQLKKIAKQNFKWMIWVLVKLMTYKQQIMFAVFIAMLVLPEFEKEHPADKRPRKDRKSVV